MRCLFAVALLISSAATAGPIADQYSAGYNGIKWDLPLADLVGMLPQGEHLFSTSPGHRVYVVVNDDPILGVPRAGMRMQYALGKNGGVESIAMGVSYERRDELLGALISQFGAYATKYEIGTTFRYDWKPDQNVQIAVRVSKDPRYGIAELWILHLNGAVVTEPCKASPANQRLERP